MIEQEDLHLTTVIGIDNTGTGIDEMFRSEATARGNTAIYIKDDPLATAKQSSTTERKKYIQVPSGTAIARPVATIALPFAGITVSFALYRSYPAAKAEPRVGARAESTNFLTSNGGSCGWIEVTAAEAVILSVLVRLASGEVGREGGSWWVVLVVVSLGGVVSLVMAEVDEKSRKDGTSSSGQLLKYKAQTCGVVKFNPTADSSLARVYCRRGATRMSCLSCLYYLSCLYGYSTLPR